MNQIPSVKALSFVKGLAKAQAAAEAGTKAKTELQKSLTQVKKMAARPGVKKNLREELENLEDNVLKVASMEKEILRKEDMDIRDLKFQIRDLKTKLALTGAQGLKPSLDKIAFLLGELASRIDTYTKIKTDREIRMEELERKIKSRMDVNFKELMQMEKTLGSLEGKYEQIRKSETSEDEKLKMIEEKITELRNKLIEKREEIVERKKQELMQVKPRLPARPIPPPKFMFPEEEEIKHKIMFPEVPPPPKPRKEPDFIPPEFPRKKGFMGWLKGLLGK